MSQNKKQAPKLAAEEKKTSSVIVLGERDALGNMPATIDGKPGYVYRAPDGTWKSVGPAGRRKFGADMQGLLESAYNASVVAAPFSDLQDLQKKPDALNAIGLVVLKTWIASGHAIALDSDRPWTEVEINQLSLIEALRRTISGALSDLNK